MKPLETRNQFWRKLLGQCAACRKDPFGHILLFFAAVALGRDEAGPEIKLIERAIHDLDWREATRYDSYDPDEAVVRFVLLQCPHGAEDVMYQVLLTGWVGLPEVRKYQLVNKDQGRILAGLLEPDDTLVLS